MEAELLEQVALDGGMAESVWREMIEASTEAAVMLYLAPPDMPEEDSAEEDMIDIGEPPDKEYEDDEKKYGRSKLGEYPAEQEEEKTLYEKESEKRASEEEQNEDNREVEDYGK